MPPSTIVMNYATTTAHSTILYIDDDSDDCLLLKETLAEAGNSTKLICASDGEEAVRYLNSIAPSALPNLIVLDLNMPRWDGKQTLRYLKSQPHLATIPVVVLSTSENNTDIDACVQLGAASYYKKPFHYTGYKHIVDGLRRFIHE